MTTNRPHVWTSKTADVGGEIHYLEAGNGPETTVLVHGLGGSHANWLPVIEPFARSARVLVPDLIGFGRTPAGGRKSTLRTNTDLLGRFLERVAAHPVVLIGNSMGGAVVARLAAERPDLIARLVLVNPALPPPKGAPKDPRVVRMFVLWSMPIVGPWVLRLGARKVPPERMVRQMLALCSHDAARIPAWTVTAMIDLARERQHVQGAEVSFVQAARDVTLSLLRRNRAASMLRSIRAPTLMVHGAHDRLVPPAVGPYLRSIRPEWVLRVIDDAGHVPQLETPDAFVRTVEDWLRASA